MFSFLHESIIKLSEDKPLEADTLHFVEGELIWTFSAVMDPTRRQHTFEEVRRSANLLVHVKERIFLINECQRTQATLNKILDSVSFANTSLNTSVPLLHRWTHFGILPITGFHRSRCTECDSLREYP